MTECSNQICLATAVDPNGQSMIFALDDQGLFCLVFKGDRGQNEIIELSQKILTGPFIWSFIKEDGKADQLFVLRPMKEHLDDWKSLSLKDAFYTGPQWDITIHEVLLGSSNDGSGATKAYPQIYLVYKERKLTTEDIWILTVNTDTKSWSNPFKFPLPVNPNQIMSKCIGNLSMYRGMFVLYKSNILDGSKVLMRFVGLDPQEKTPVIQSIDQIVPDGAAQIATFDNADGLTDLLIAGKQLWWLSADACIQGRQKATAIDESSTYAGSTQLQIVQNKDEIVVWSVAPSSAPTSQKFAIAGSNTKPMKKAEATPAPNQDQKSDHFALIPRSGAGQKTILITQNFIQVLLEETRAEAHAPEIAAAREKYISLLDDTIQLYDQLDTNLDSVNKAAKAADDKLSETYRTLEDHIKATKIATTVGSGVSILGALLLFTPAAPLGVGLIVGGGGTSIGSSVAQSFFDSDASKAFTEVIDNYNKSSKALEDLLKGIENVSGKLTDALVEFLTLVHTYPFPDSPAYAPPLVPGPPGSPPVGGPGAPYLPNQFSNIASKALALRAAQAGSSGAASIGLKTSAGIAEMLGKNGAKVLSKALPMLGKAIPVVSIAVDLVQILSTWTNNNETLQQASKLKSNLAANAEAFRQAVKTFQSDLEEQVGNAALRDSLKKLLKLRKPNRPPMGPELACKMMDQMQQMEDVPLMMFITYDPNKPREKADKVPPQAWLEVQPGDEHQHEEPDDQIPPGSYTVEMVPKEDVLQLSQKALAAPVVDAAYEQHPKSGDLDDDKGQPLESAAFGGAPVSFRNECSTVRFGDKDVYNVSGSSRDHRARSWWKFWSDFGREEGRGGCLIPRCKVRLNGIDWHNILWIVGGHMEKRRYDGYWYILPICQRHNAPRGTYDRGNPNGYFLTTHTNAWAVRIDPA